MGNSPLSHRRRMQMLLLSYVIGGALIVRFGEEGSLVTASLSRTTLAQQSIIERTIERLDNELESPTPSSPPPVVTPPPASSAPAVVQPSPPPPPARSNRSNDPFADPYLWGKVERTVGDAVDVLWNAIRYVATWVYAFAMRIYGVVMEQF